MVKLNKYFKKGQALPLNTIVIAILVIIVLLVIIVFFTSRMATTSDSLEGVSVSSCDISNPTLSSLGYIDAKKINDGGNTLVEKKEKCSDIGEGWISATIIPNCCVTKGPAN